MSDIGAVACCRLGLVCRTENFAGGSLVAAGAAAPPSTRDVGLQPEMVEISSFPCSRARVVRM